MPTGFSQSNNLVVNANDASVSRTNVNVNSVSRTGNKIGTYSDIFYNRIWIIPSSINLTGAPTTFSTGVAVWNSYFTSKTMTAVTPTNIFGITFAPTVPKTFKSLEYTTYTLSLTPSVPASVNGFYTFTFSDAEDPVLNITGVLSVALPFFHDWGSETALTERISYLTGVIESKNGREQRSRLRKYPRRQFVTNNLLADGSDNNRNALQRALFHNATTFGLSKTWLIPVNQDARYLGYSLASGSSVINVNTQYHDYSVNGYVLLYKGYDNYEVVRIQSLANTNITLVAPTTKQWDSSTTVVPMRQCVHGQETLDSNVITYDLESQSTLWDVLVQDKVDTRKIPYTPTHFYKGYDVYLTQTDFSQDTSGQIYNPQRRLDNPVGLFRIDSRYATTKQKYPFSLLLKTKQEIAEFLGFIEYRAGKLNPFWFPSFGNDFQIALSGLAADTTIRVKNIGYSTYLNASGARKDVVFMKADGTPVFRRVTGASDNGDGTETLSIDQALGFDFSLSTFRYISFLNFVRFDTDIFEFVYITSDIATVSTKVVDVFEVP